MKGERLIKASREQWELIREAHQDLPTYDELIDKINTYLKKYDDIKGMEGGETEEDMCRAIMEMTNLKQEDVIEIVMNVSSVMSALEDDALGHELSDEELMNIAGGGMYKKTFKPVCSAISVVSDTLESDVGFCPASQVMSEERQGDKKSPVPYAGVALVAAGVGTETYYGISKV